MNYDLSDQVRSVAVEKHVSPAIRDGKTHFSLAVRDLMQDLRPLGFPAKNWPQICTAIQSKKFLRANGLEIEAVEGPPSKQSSTVVVRYRLASARQQTELSTTAVDPSQEIPKETPEEWAHRVTGRLAGLLKDEIAAYGGAEEFMRWVRSDSGDAA